jgi:hypothetical protein
VLRGDPLPAGSGWQSASLTIPAHVARIGRTHLVQTACRDAAAVGGLAFSPGWSATIGP